MLKLLVESIRNYIQGGNMTEYDYKVDLARDRLKEEELDRMIESLYIECGKFKRVRYYSGRTVTEYNDPSLVTETGPMEMPFLYEVYHLLNQRRS